MRILIADDHQFILESIEILLSTIPEYEVVATFNNGKELFDSLNFHENIDLVMTDYNMPQMNGIELTYQIRQKYPQIKILLLTVSEEVQTIQEAFQAGVSGYVMKKAGKEEFEKAIKVVSSGKKYYSESVVFELLNRDKKISDLVGDNLKDDLAKLSIREIEIIKLIAEENSTNEIAEKLFLSPATVETHRHNILKKLGIKNSIGLVKFALKNSII
ncbi:DNA-binding response regulator [Lacihabitans sp. LS3-19]|uniref:response regulator n=1 Tax=Lacihabitans sp. LS3-19 TaxID=2487335 RepID=UPI0020CC9CAD|nr:response regulator transcription factor [Lacihabitans sp. LS3-19]MCP9766847.1 DNA-binding response regulator [Lacihabitans sp. LS3-19]